MLPGLGRLLITSINERDFPVVQSVTLIFAAGFVIVNMLADVIYTLIDPRTRSSMSPDRTAAVHGRPVPRPTTRASPFAGSAALWHNPNGRIVRGRRSLVVLAAGRSARRGHALSGPSPRTPGRARRVPVLQPPGAPTSSAGTCSRSSSQGLYVSLKIACLAVLIAGVIGTVGGHRGRLPGQLDLGVDHAGDRHALRHPGHPPRPGHRDRARAGHG